MANSSYLRDRAERALRLARASADPTLQKSLTELALEYFARAVAVEAKQLGKIQKTIEQKTNHMAYSSCSG